MDIVQHSTIYTYAYMYINSFLLSSCTGHADNKFCVLVLHTWRNASVLHS